MVNIKDLKQKIIMSRIWKDIKGYEGLYQISDDGLVKSLERVGIDKNNRRFPVKEKILTLKLPKGAFYYQILLYKNSNYKLFRIHRLVADAFLYKSDKNQEVNHKDGNKLNNRKDNLEWVTKSENINHSHVVLKQDNGENRYNSKLKEKDVLEIRNSNLSQNKLAKIYNVSKTCIQQVKSGKSWKQTKN